MMQSFFISLPSDPIRYKNFLYYNRHVPGITLFPGINGKDFLRKHGRQKDLIAKTCKWKAGQLGCGLSHASLWMNAVKTSNVTTIFEDDAHLCRNFEHESHKILEQLPADFDVILWGANPGTYYTFGIVPGTAKCHAYLDKSDVWSSLDNFCNRRISTNFFPLNQAFGTLGYTVSPKGAKKLIEHCLPFDSIPVFSLSTQNHYIADGIDGVLNRFYSSMKAFITSPPLALVKDDIEKSSTKFL